MEGKLSVSGWLKDQNNKDEQEHSQEGASYWWAGGMLRSYLKQYMLFKYFIFCNLRYMVLFPEVFN